MENGDIDISKMDKAAVLAALYNASRPMGMGVFQARANISIEEARTIMTEGSSADYGSPQTTRFDYLHGRPLKINLGGDTLRTALFDRDNGKGAAEAALRAAGLITGAPQEPTA